MYIANIEYYDINMEHQRTICYFRLDKLGMARFVYKYPNEAATLHRMITAADEKSKKNVNPTFEEMENMIAALCAASYGNRVGDKFVSDPDSGNEFIGSEAYCEFAGDLFLNPDKFVAFAKAIAPGLDYSMAEAELAKIGGSENV